MLSWSDNTNGAYNVFIDEIFSDSQFIGTSGPLTTPLRQVSAMVSYNCNMGTTFNPNWEVMGRFVAGGNNGMSAQISIATGTGQQVYPAVATGLGSQGQVFVTWSDNGHTFQNLTYDILGARYVITGSSCIFPQTCTVGAQGSTITVGGGANASSSAAPDTHSDGVSNFFTVWGDGRNNGLLDIYGGRRTGPLSDFEVCESGGRACYR